MTTLALTEKIAHAVSEVGETIESRARASEGPIPSQRRGAESVPDKREPGVSVTIKGCSQICRTPARRCKAFFAGLVPHFPPMRLTARAALQATWSAHLKWAWLPAHDEETSRNIEGKERSGSRTACSPYHSTGLDSKTWKD